MPPVQNINLPQIFLAARQARAADEKIRLMQAERKAAEDRTKMLNQLQVARQRASTGDLSLLRALAPEEVQQREMGALELQKRQQELQAGRLGMESQQLRNVGQRLQNVQTQQQGMQMQQRGQADAMERYRLQALHGGRAMLQVGQTLKENPGAWPQVRQQLESMGRAGLIDPSQIPVQPPTPDKVEQQIRSARDTIAIFGDPNISGLGRQVAESLGLPIETAIRDPRFQEEMGKQLQERAKPAQTTIQVDARGRQPIDKTVRRELQQSHIENKKTLASINELESLDMDKFLTVQGQMMGGATRWLDKLGVASETGKEFLRERRRASEVVERISNEYRKRITGAGASVQELERLKDAVLNMDLGPTEFKASLERFQSELKRTMRLERKILREGLDLTPEEFGQRLDMARAEGADATSSADISARSRELRSGGLSDVATLRTLASEGYITQAQMQAAMQKLQQSGAQ